MSKKNPLLIAVHGIDNRLLTTVTLFLKGPCGGVGRIASSNEDVDIDMFDIDQPASKKLFDQHLQEDLVRPVIALSVRPITLQEGILYLKKPVNTELMLDILGQAQKLKAKLTKKANTKQTPPVQHIHQEDQTPEPSQPKNEFEEAANSASNTYVAKVKGKTNAKTQAMQPSEVSTIDELDDWFTSSL